MAGAKKVEWHAHGCKECKGRYTDTCEDRTVNALCIGCRTGKEVSPLFIEGYLPRPCCEEFCRPVKNGKNGTVDEKKQYKLAGDNDWYICDTAKGGCARTFIYMPGSPADPRKQKD